MSRSTSNKTSELENKVDSYLKIVSVAIAFPCFQPLLAVGIAWLSELCSAYWLSCVEKSSGLRESVAPQHLAVLFLLCLAGTWLNAWFSFFTPNCRAPLLLPSSSKSDARVVLSALWSILDSWTEGWLGSDCPDLLRFLLLEVFVLLVWRGAWYDVFGSEGSKYAELYAWQHRPRRSCEGDLQWKNCH